MGAEGEKGAKKARTGPGQGKGGGRKSGGQVVASPGGTKHYVLPGQERNPRHKALGKSKGANIFPSDHPGADQSEAQSMVVEGLRNDMDMLTNQNYDLTQKLEALESAALDLFKAKAIDIVRWQDYANGLISNIQMLKEGFKPPQAPDTTEMPVWLTTIDDKKTKQTMAALDLTREDSG